MIPGKERIEEMRSKIKDVMKRMSVRMGVLKPFIEELFEYSGSLTVRPDWNKQESWLKGCLTVAWRITS